MSSDNAWSKSATALAANNSDPILLPSYAERFMVMAKPGGGGSCTVYLTCDDPDSVSADPDSATWVAWDTGSVSADTVKALTGHPTALRLAAVTADAVLTVSGRRTNR